MSATTLRRLTKPRAGVCALTVIFVLVCVPETKGKTLAQIQLELSEVSLLIEPY